MGDLGDVLSLGVQEPLLADLIQSRLEAAVSAAATISDAGSKRVEAATRVVQLATTLAMVLRWQGLLSEAIRVLEESDVDTAVKVLAPLDPPLPEVAPVCARCDCGTEYPMIDDFSAPDCTCLPVVTPAMTAKRNYDIQMARVLRLRCMGEPEELARRLASVSGASGL